jgi:hypothetical protein
MSRNRVIITLLAIFLIAGVISLAAAAQTGADDQKQSADPHLIKKIDPKAPMSEPIGGTPGQGTSNYVSWSGYAKIGGGYTYIYGTTGYQYLYVSEVYGGDSGFAGYYRCYPTTSFSSGHATQSLYEVGVDNFLHNHWVYMYVNSNGYIYDIDLTPYTYGTL